MIPDLRGLRASFLSRLEESGAFSATERREALERMFSDHGYEWSFLCPVCRGKRALLIPAPWSIAPLILSDRFAELVVWEPDSRRAEVLDSFYRDLKTPVRVINAPLDHLTLHTERYDVLALEDSFAQLHDCDPEEAESWAARLLEPGGQCCIVTASRYGRGLLKGNVVGLARELRRLFQRGYLLPSLGGLQRRMRRASLVNQRTFSFYPDHRKPREILGWNGTLPRHVHGNVYKLLDRLGVIARMHDGFMIVAGQRELTSGLVDELLTHIREELDLEELPAVDECRVQRTGVLLFFLDLHKRGEAVLRVPVHRRAALRMAAYDEVLQLLSARAPQIYSYAPEQLSSGSLGDVPYFLETKLPGVAADDIIVASENERWIVDQAFEFLERLAGVEARYDPIDDGAFAEVHVRPLFDTLCRHYTGLSEELRTLQSFLVNRTEGRKIPLIWVHGDFNTRNVLVHPQERRITGVIDWDLATDSGLPLQDLLHFILSIHRGLHQIGIGEAVVRALEGSLFRPEDESILGRYCALLDLDETMVTPMLIIYWARHVAAKFGEMGKVLSEGWSQENVIEPLRQIRWLIE